MKITVLLVAFFTLTNVAFSQCSDLFFSEYIEGSSTNKAIEIYNPTSGTIDLADYEIHRFNNGAVTATGTLDMVGTVAPGDVFVIGDPGSNAAIMAVSDTLHNITFFNGDDALLLINTLTADTIDVIGELGVDPGTAWTVGAGSTQNFTLVRMANIQQGTNNWAVGQNQWDVFPIDMTDSLGAHYMIPCGAPCTNTSSTIADTVCDTYTAPDGMSYTSTGQYTATIPNAGGCDSVITINLIVNNATTATLNESACGSFTLNNVTYTNSGTYTQQFTNAVGCDSTLTLILDITPIPAAPTVMGDTVYCDGETPTALTVASSVPTDSLIISGVADATLTGGLPKAIEFYVLEDIADLSTYGFGSANNGGGTDGEEFTFPAVAVTAGTYIHVATDSANFFTWFGFYPDYNGGTAANINGDDAIELFHNGAVIDVFGDINTDGTGQPWEYLDGWAYRKDNAVPNGGTFDIGEWILSGPNALDGESNNASAATPIPVETYTNAPVPTTITWYSDANLTNVITTGNSYTPAATPGTVSYYVTATANGTNNCEGPATTVNVTTANSPTVTANASVTTVCEGDDVTLTGSGASTYQWDNGVTDGVAFAATTTTTYTVTGTSTEGCTAQDSVEVIVNPLPNVAFSALDTVCVNASPVVLTQGSPAGGTYSGTAVANDEFDPATAGVGTYTLSYEYTDNSGCTATATSDIVVDGCAGIEELNSEAIVLFPNPAATYVSVSGATAQKLQVVDLSGTVVSESTSNTISVEGLASGMYLLTITTETGTIAKPFVKK